MATLENSIKSPEGDSFVVVQNEDNIHDSSFEEIHEEQEAFNRVDYTVEEMDQDDKSIVTIAEDKANESCNENIRQVLDDVEAQIERMREQVAKIVTDKDNLTEVLDSINQSLANTELSDVEREEIGLEVSRLQV